MEGYPQYMYQNQQYTPYNNAPLYGQQQQQQQQQQQPMTPVHNAHTQQQQYQQQQTLRTLPARPSASNILPPSSAFLSSKQATNSTSTTTNSSSLATATLSASSAFPLSPTSSRYEIACARVLEQRYKRTLVELFGAVAFVFTLFNVNSLLNIESLGDGIVHLISLLFAMAILTGPLLLLNLVSKWIFTVKRDVRANRFMELVKVVEPKFAILIATFVMSSCAAGWVTSVWNTWELDLKFIQSPREKFGRHQINLTWLYLLTHSLAMGLSYGANYVWNNQYEIKFPTTEQKRSKLIKSRLPNAVISALEFSLKFNLGFYILYWIMGTPIYRTSTLLASFFQSNMLEKPHVPLAPFWDLWMHSLVTSLLVSLCWKAQQTLFELLLTEPIRFLPKCSFDLIIDGLVTSSSSSNDATTDITTKSDYYKLLALRELNHFAHFSPVLRKRLWDDVDDLPTPYHRIMESCVREMDTLTMGLEDAVKWFKQRKGGDGGFIRPIRSGTTLTVSSMSSSTSSHRLGKPIPLRKRQDSAISEDKTLAEKMVGAFTNTFIGSDQSSDVPTLFRRKTLSVPPGLQSKSGNTINNAPLDSQSIFKKSQSTTSNTASTNASLTLNPTDILDVTSKLLSQLGTRLETIPAFRYLFARDTKRHMESVFAPSYPFVTLAMDVIITLNSFAAVEDTWGRVVMDLPKVLSSLTRLVISVEEAMLLIPMDETESLEYVLQIKRAVKGFVERVLVDERGNKQTEEGKVVVTAIGKKGKESVERVDENESENEIDMMNTDTPAMKAKYLVGMLTRGLGGLKNTYSDYLDQVKGELEGGVLNRLERLKP